MRDTNRLLGAFDSLERLDQLVSDQNITAEPIKTNQVGISAAASLYVYKVGPDIVTAFTTNTVTLSSNIAEVGDILSFTSGTLDRVQIKVKSVDGFIYTLVNDLPVLPSISDTLDVLRYRYPVVDPSGATVITGNITVNSQQKSNVNEYNEITSVATSVLSTILTYTIPSSIDGFYLNVAEVSGTNIANYSVLVNGIVVARKYTYFGGELNADFPFFGHLLTPGNIITIQVVHNRPYVGDFSARLLGNLV